MLWLLGFFPESVKRAFIKLNEEDEEESVSDEEETKEDEDQDAFL